MHKSAAIGFSTFKNSAYQRASQQLSSHAIFGSKSVNPTHMNLRKFYSTKLKKNSIYILSIPITTHKSYIYCNHRTGALDPGQLKKFPLITKLEAKLTQLALKGWTKLSTSQMSVNIKITELAKKLLDTIPYEESCLRSFPSKKSMIREINEESLENLKKITKSSKLIQTQIDELAIPSSQIKPIPLYHAQFQSPALILNQIYGYVTDSYNSHVKYAIFCAIGIPITLPFALIPVIPNVPGIYLAYRLYCHIKAIMGVKHLEYILEDSDLKFVRDKIINNETVGDTKHIDFDENHDIDKAYEKQNTAQDLIIDSVQEEERIIITKDIIDELVENLGIEHLKDDLHKALRQESARLNKGIKVDEPVQ